MTDREKRKVAEMVTMEQKWLYDHPEYSIPQWYVNLIISAAYRLQLNDYDGAAHDIKQAITGRMESMGVMTDLQHIPLWELEMHETALDEKLDAAPAYLRTILTPTQYKYYTYYIYGGIKLADIAMYFDVDITTVCHGIRRARKRVLDYVSKQVV